MMHSRVYKRMLLALGGCALLLLGAPSQAAGPEKKLEACLDQANGAHEVSQCYWKHFERQASFGR